MNLSKTLSYILRHNPRSAGLDLDEGGWVDLGLLAAALNTEPQIIISVIESDLKQRYEMKSNLVRAAQGHSIPVDLGLSPTAPPATLYHGTVGKNVESIRSKGVLKGARHAVHLSAEIGTAKQVGARRGEPVILEVESGRMSNDGFIFTKSTNGVWLTEIVPPEYIKK